MVREVGDGIIEGLKEALAWTRGEKSLVVVSVDPDPTVPVQVHPEQGANSPKDGKRSPTTRR